MHKMVGLYICVAFVALGVLKVGGLADRSTPPSGTNGTSFSASSASYPSTAAYQGNGSKRVMQASTTRDETEQRGAKKPRAKRSIGSASAKRDRAGHYTFNAYLNGRSNRVLVDTGATSVAINLSTARRIGLNIGPDDFKHIARTANGEVKMAQATIGSVEIDGVQVRNVQAAVLPDNALSDILLGMSFLNKLDRFEFRDGSLVLYQ